MSALDTPQNHLALFEQSSELSALQVCSHPATAVADRADHLLVLPDLLVVGSLDPQVPVDGGLQLGVVPLAVRVVGAAVPGSDDAVRCDARHALGVRPA